MINVLTSCHELVQGFVDLEILTAIHIYDPLSILMQRSDSEMLSEMLSSRSYLDLPHEQPQAQIENDEDQSTGELITNEPYNGPRTRSKRTLPQAPSVPDRVLVSRDLPASDRHARKRGRPRLETIKDDAAIEVDPESPHITETSVLTSPLGTPSPDSACATHLSTQERDHDSNPQSSG